VDGAYLARPIAVLATADLCVITLPVADVYPTQNTMFAGGSRRGKKIPEYDFLRVASRVAGETALALGFGAVESSARCELTLYCEAERYPDAGNLGKAELDGLEDAGLCANDKFFRPVHFDIRTDGGGPRRVVIVIHRALNGRPTPAGKRGGGKTRVAAPQCAGPVVQAANGRRGVDGFQDVLDGRRRPKAEELADILRRIR